MGRYDFVVGFYLVFKYSLIAQAALRPPTMAVTTRSGPVTQSPPEKTPGREVAPVFLSAVTQDPNHGFQDLGLSCR